TATGSPLTRAAMLDNFYFNGLGGGFLPVVHIDNYGHRTGPVATGQVRTDQFMQPPWTLREFKVRLAPCPSSTCGLNFVPSVDATNPGGTLFDPLSTHPLAPVFQASTGMPSQVPALAVNNINLFSMTSSNVFNSGQSNSQGPENNYLFQFGPN